MSSSYRGGLRAADIEVMEASRAEIFVEMVFSIFVFWRRRQAVKIPARLLTKFADKRRTSPVPRRELSSAQPSEKDEGRTLVSHVLTWERNVATAEVGMGVV